MAVLSRLLNKVFLLSRNKAVTVAREEREKAGGERETGQGIPRRGKSNRENEGERKRQGGEGERPREDGQQARQSEDNGG